MNNQMVQVALAIIYQDDRFLMQLRDDIPQIHYPGCWGLFGGHIEVGETPEVAVKREIIEEINYDLPSFSKFDVYIDEKVIRHVFQAPMLVELNQLVLDEGWDMGLLTADDIQRGNCYSEIAQQIRPLGDVHQKILLDFINKKP